MLRHFCFIFILLCTCILHASAKNCRTATQTTEEGYKGHIQKVNEEVYLAVKTNGTYRPDSTTTAGRQAHYTTVKQYYRDGAIAARYTRDHMDSETWDSYTYRTPLIQDQRTTYKGKNSKQETTSLLHRSDRATWQWLTDNSYRLVHGVYLQDIAEISSKMTYDSVLLDTMQCTMAHSFLYTISPGKGTEMKLETTKTYSGDTLRTVLLSGDRKETVTYSTITLATDAMGNATTTLQLGNGSPRLIYTTYEYYTDK